MRPIIDPRKGDFEDDALSTKRHSMLSLARNLLAEISLAKLMVAWTVLILIPGLLLGSAPLVVSTWLSVVMDKAAALAGAGSLIVLCLLVAIGWFGLRHVFGHAERSFWSLNALLVQPIYVLTREAVRHIATRFMGAGPSDVRRSQLSAAAAAVAGVAVFTGAASIAGITWPMTRWSASIADLAAPIALSANALANMVFLIAAYLGASSLFWGLADATMGHVIGRPLSNSHAAAGKQWRIAHLSDIHVVGEQYGFRIECGRDGPSGNRCIETAFAKLAEIHADHPIDHVLITGDLTDAGRSSEWIECLALIERHPELRERTLVLPGNHDLNVVDRSNPARFELPMSPGKRLRHMRFLSALCGIQGDKARTVNYGSYTIGPTLAEAVEPHREAIASFATSGRLRLSLELGSIWSDVFPLVVLPSSEGGLGFVLLNSNAEANFSFTNALGLIPYEDARALIAVIRSMPKAFWIIGLHHHLFEYPMPGVAFSERIGTALVNGSWLLRQLRPFAERVVIMHGHRHIDWMGQCAGLRVISAPSPVMPTKDGRSHAFYVHTFVGADGRLALQSSDRIEVNEVGA